MERMKVGPHAVLFMSMRIKENDFWVYSIYIATNIESNTIAVFFVPANNSKEIGDYFFKVTKEQMIAKDSSLSPEQKSKERMHQDTAKGVTSYLENEKGEADSVAIEWLMKSAKEGEARSHDLSPILVPG